MALTLQQEKLVALHVNGASNVDVAKKLGISRPTVISWLKKPEIQQAIAVARESRAEVLDLVSEQKQIEKILTLSRIEEGMIKAYEVLLEVLENPDERASNKLKSAEILFSLPSRIYNLNKSISTVLSFGYKVVDKLGNDADLE